MYFQNAIDSSLALLYNRNVWSLQLELSEVLIYLEITSFSKTKIRSGNSLTNSGTNSQMQIFVSWTQVYWILFSLCCMSFPGEAEIMMLKTTDLYLMADSLVTKINEFKDQI